MKEFTLENTDNMILHSQYKRELLSGVRVLLVGEEHETGYSMD